MAADGPVGSVPEMIDSGAAIADIGAVLDALDPDTRWATVSRLGLFRQRRLYALAAEAPPLTLEAYVGADLPALRPVVHRGRNTLPFPGFTHFEKIFTRQPNGVIIGYNQGIARYLFGPGYYSTVHTPQPWVERGAVVVDYYQAPREGPVPPGWPWLRPNWVGLQVFVYFQTRDFMRRVSEHVTIGAAYKWSNLKMGQYFLLCRVD